MVEFRHSKIDGRCNMNKEEIKQDLHNVFTIETKAGELADNIEKLKTLIIEIRDNYFCLDEKNNADDVLCYHNEMGIKCDMLKDYVDKSQELIKDISCLAGETLGRKLDTYDACND